MFYEIILDSQETANKCTIAPLIHRPDFHVFRVRGATTLGPLHAPILLHHQGQCLTKIRDSLQGDLANGLGSTIQGIASIDCVWRRLDPLIHRITGKIPQFARIPDGFETAYPRRSSKNTDPDGGLATIEAIFVASAILGNWDSTLFSEYYFGRKFIALNALRFQELGVDEAGLPHTLPPLPNRPRNSLQRRLDRGRV